MSPKEAFNQLIRVLEHELEESKEVDCVDGSEVLEKNEKISALLFEIKKLEEKWDIEINLSNKKLKPNLFYTNHLVDYFAPILLSLVKLGGDTSKYELKHKFLETVKLSAGELNEEPYSNRKTGIIWKHTYDNAIRSLVNYGYINKFRITESGRKYLDHELNKYFLRD